MKPRVGSLKRSTNGQTFSSNDKEKKRLKLLKPGIKEGDIPNDLKK